MDLLYLLRAGQGGYLSGSALARNYGLSRAAVWKHIEDLRARGYVIEAKPRLGYRLLASPDALTAEEVLPVLSTKSIGRYYHFFEELASTNDEAKRLGAAGAPAGTLVVAERQTAGRGRLGRTWTSPPGGLWLSLLLRPNLPLADLGPLTVLAAVALAKALARETGVKARIKWPNDLLVEQHKIAGILAEAQGELGCANQVVLGLGLNVNQETADFPADIRARATSLRGILGHEMRRAPILRAFLEVFEDLYEHGLIHGFRDVLAQAAANSATLGHPVRITGQSGVLEGLAVRLDPDGALVVRTATGDVRVMAGDIE